jgi:CO/xanthine dehydrogenase FAD-binding subunit
VALAVPGTLSEAIEALEGTPKAQLLAGGTDFCVQVGFGHRRPTEVIALRRIDELRGWSASSDAIRLGALTTYTEMIAHLGELLPGLASAARSVGSPQIRNVGTLGGNVATASPAGDTLPVLVALDARVGLAGPTGQRSVALSDLVTGPKRTSMLPGEIIVDVTVSRPRGPQHFLKVGTRNAMVISIASVAISIDLELKTVACGLGSVGPVPLRTPNAEAFMASEINWTAMSASESALERFGALAASESSPIDDHRSSERYRRKAIAVISQRGLRRCLRDAA